MLDIKFVRRTVRRRREHTPLCDRGETMNMDAPLIVGIGGALRDGSTSERALRIALGEAERLGARTRIFAGQLLNIAAYDPAEKNRSVVAAELVDALRCADGIIIATPSYHGSISGLIKNAVDYAEDLRKDTRVYFSGRAVGAIVCADGIQAMGSTLATLRAIIHALRGWPTPFSATINSALRPFTADGKCTDLSSGGTAACFRCTTGRGVRADASSLPSDAAGPG
jgi:FMN reductase